MIIIFSHKWPLPISYCNSWSILIIFGCSAHLVKVLLVCHAPVRWPRWEVEPHYTVPVLLSAADTQTDINQGVWYQQISDICCVNLWHNVHNNDTYPHLLTISIVVLTHCYTLCLSSMLTLLTILFLVGLILLMMTWSQKIMEFSSIKTCSNRV